MVHLRPFRNLKTIIFLLISSLVSVCLIVYCCHCRTSFIPPTREKYLPGSQSFTEFVKIISWTKLAKSIMQLPNNTGDFISIAEEILDDILPHLLRPPDINVNESCLAPEPKLPDIAPECNPVLQERKIAMAFCLGYDADVLEIVMHEVNLLVDKFFILESTASYLMNIRKPLVWERLQQQERFRPFRDKVVHLLMDDSDLQGKQPLSHLDIAQNRFTYFKLGPKTTWNTRFFEMSP